MDDDVEMNYGKILTGLLIGLQICAFVGYTFNGDYRKGLYMLLGAMITMVAVW